MLQERKIDISCKLPNVDDGTTEHFAGPSVSLNNLLQLPDLHEVGICTVQRSSDDSSVDVPMKS